MPNASNVAEVEAIKGRLDGSVAALLTEYRGLKVAELGELRASLRGSSTEYRVLKNTLTSIAVREAGYEAGTIDPEGYRRGRLNEALRVVSVVAGNPGGI